ncbi:hypothetical protein Lal_00036805 [Lupinus albus]|nr:hypothetical protein Lal_00036805 [Lupinus albus]
MIKGNNKLWCKIFCEKYLEDSGMVYAYIRPFTSSVWKSIVKATMELRDDFSLQLGDGNRSFSYDNWSISNTSVERVFSTVKIVKNMLCNQMGYAWMDNCVETYT